MPRSHGDATRLVVEGVDPQEINEIIDEIVASGGVDDDGVREDAVRMAVANNFLGPKRFGKLFPELAPFRPPDDALRRLGRAMKESASEEPGADDSEIPAGFTYLGQFVDHDITFDQTVGFPVINDPEEIEQARTPTLDLDSLYGRGPRRQPELYDPSTRPSRARFRIGRTNPTFDVNVALPNDLPRTPDATAIIGDPRNDENLVVAQTHLAFLKFHNQVIETVPQDDDDDGTATFTQAEEERKNTPFHKAHRLVRWHYQWLVLNDFLPRLVDPNVLNDIKSNGRRFFEFQDRPFMPLEFSAAAYRFGHSMVREIYNYNRVFTNATLSQLFTFTGGGGGAPIPSNWVIDWRKFFGVGPLNLRNFARKIDTELTLQLHTLPGTSPGQPSSLAVRNLLRGSRIGLPRAQDVAEAMGVTPLTPNQIANGQDGQILRDTGFDEETPLWYYILKEAEVQNGGDRLGQIGGRIVGEVFFGLVEGDPNSFMARQPDWKPRLPSQQEDDFTMGDLLRLVGEINPIGGS